MKRGNKELLVVGAICLLFLAHVRSALVALLVLPIGLLVSILLMTLLGRQCPALPAEVLFSDLEIQVLEAYAKKNDCLSSDSLVMPCVS